ncbi:MAG: hypothetical protein GY705_24130 [Bacteroidetes bacterium]|nr:hypothetical protein [Bacteroidota bacterium]
MKRNKSQHIQAFESDKKQRGRQAYLIAVNAECSLSAKAFPCFLQLNSTQADCVDLNRGADYVKIKLPNMHKGKV